MLKPAGADINATDTRGRIPLLAACGCLSGSVEVARMLLEEGADPALADLTKCTPLHAVAEHGITKSVDVLYNKALATLNLHTTDGRTPFFSVRLAGRESVVSRLLSLGAIQSRPQENHGMVPLEVAVVSKRPHGRGACPGYRRFQGGGGHGDVVSSPFMPPLQTPILPDRRQSSECCSRRTER